MPVSSGLLTVLPNRPFRAVRWLPGDTEAHKRWSIGGPWQDDDGEYWDVRTMEGGSYALESNAEFYLILDRRVMYPFRPFDDRYVTDDSGDLGIIAVYTPDDFNRLFYVVVGDDEQPAVEEAGAGDRREVRGAADSLDGETAS